MVIVRFWGLIFVSCLFLGIGILFKMRVLVIVGILVIEGYIEGVRLLGILG